MILVYSKNSDWLNILFLCLVICFPLRPKFFNIRLIISFRSFIQETIFKRPLKYSRVNCFNNIFDNV